MSRHSLSLSPEPRTAFDLEAFRGHAPACKPHHLEACPTPFPTAPSRWLSHDQCTPRPIALTSRGEVEGGLRGLGGATIDCSFTRSMCAPHSGARGGACYAPASLVVLAGAAQGEQYVDYARFCDELHPQDNGRR
jgi:hypothetical protein